MVPNSPYYLASIDGTLRFTSTGKTKLRERFQMAGICIDDIRTHNDYIQAQSQASHLFGEWLADIAHELPIDGQYALIRAVLLSEPLPK